MDKIKINREIISEKKAIVLESELTRIKKLAFINEIKNGLGEQIKAKPNKVKIHKKTLIEKIGFFIKMLLTKF